MYTHLHSKHKGSYKNQPSKDPLPNRKKINPKKRDTYNPNTTHTAHQTQKQIYNNNNLNNTYHI